MNPKIDILILTSNEEDVIGDAIKSVSSWAENIFVIDSGSIDKTVDIAKKKGAIVIEHPFKDFSSQRNFAIKKAKSPWVMYLDADERVTDGFRKEVQGLILNGEYAGLEIRRKTYYLGQDWGFTDKVARVFKVDKFLKWEGVVHETAHIKGELGLVDSRINHFTHRNLEQMLTKTNSWSDYEANLRLESGHPKIEGWRLLRVMLSGFLKSYFNEGGYRNGTRGFIESIYQSYSMFITYAKLWEMQNRKKA